MFTKYISSSKSRDKINDLMALVSYLETTFLEWGVGSEDLMLKRRY